MHVTCPKCGLGLEYNPNPNTIRPRKLCPSCNTKFKVCVGRLSGGVDQGSNQVDQGPKNGPCTVDQKASVVDHAARRTSLKKIKLTYHLDDRDYTIIDLATRDPPPNQKRPSQSQIASKIGISPEATRKRLDKLVALKILIEISKRPRQFVLTDSYTAFDEEERLLVQPIHGYKLKCTVLGNWDAFNKFRESCPKQNNQIKNWVKKYYYENDLCFEVNTKSVVFHPSGWGKTHEESKSNAMDKATHIRDRLQTEYGLKLSHPIELNNQPETVFIWVKSRVYEKMRSVVIWNDQSHKNLWETKDNEIGDVLQDSVNNQIELRAETTELKNKQSELEGQVTNIKTEIKTLGNKNKSPDFDAQVKKLNERIDSLDNKLGNVDNKLSQMVGTLNRLVDVMTRSGSSSNPENNRGDLYT